MHKCLNCGKEYEGNFCPFCGAHMGEEKLCPKCGTHCSPNAKFCNNCGYAFDGAEKSVSKNTGSISESTIKIHLFAEYLPLALIFILCFIVKSCVFCLVMAVTHFLLNLWLIDGYYALLFVLAYSFRPSKIAVWLYRERKILCGVALTVVILFAIITILL